MAEHELTFESRVKTWQQIKIFACMYIGYMSYVLDKKSFAYVIPTLMEQRMISRDEVGATLSSLALGLLIGQFVGGILVDSVSPRNMFCAGLVLTGSLNLLISLSEPSYFQIIWFLNGLSQGPGWCSCAKIIKSWYSIIVFATVWSLLSTSINVAQSLGPFVTSLWLLESNGVWQPVMIFLAAASYLMAVIAYFTLKDKPDDDIAAMQLNNQSNQEISSETSHTDNLQQKMMRIAFSPYAYVVCSGCLAAHFGKDILYDWGTLYLIQEKNAGLLEASKFIIMMEFGGMVGSVVFGYVSDLMVASIHPSRMGHPRHVVVVPCMLLFTSALFLLRTQVDNVRNEAFFVSFLALCIGASSYTIVNLLGVLAIEAAPKSMSGTSHAVSALFGNIGSVMAGFPFSILMVRYSWDVAISVCELAVVAAAFVFIFAEAMRIPCLIGDNFKPD